MLFYWLFFSDLQLFSEQAAAATPPRKKSRFRSDQRQRVTMDTGSVPEETGSVPMETSSVPMEMREEVKQKSAEDTEGHMDSECCSASIYPEGQV